MAQNCLTCAIKISSPSKQSNHLQTTWNGPWLVLAPDQCPGDGLVGHGQNHFRDSNRFDNQIPMAPKAPGRCVIYEYPL